MMKLVTFGLIGLMASMGFSLGSTKSVIVKGSITVGSLENEKQQYEEECSVEFIADQMKVNNKSGSSDFSVYSADASQGAALSLGHKAGLVQAIASGTFNGQKATFYCIIPRSELPPEAQSKAPQEP